MLIVGAAILKKHQNAKKQQNEHKTQHRKNHH
jgi:hypothetical protein